jgi:hypothetical protein
LRTPLKKKHNLKALTMQQQMKKTHYYTSSKHYNEQIKILTDIKDKKKSKQCGCIKNNKKEDNHKKVKLL